MRWLSSFVVAVVMFVCAAASFAAGPSKVFKAGIIGLDTSHVIAFTKAFNDPKVAEDLAPVKIVAAFPGGVRDNPSSWDRVPKYTEQIRTMGVEIVPSIAELLKKVDVVFLESVDGRPHLEQARPVIAAGKPLFIDKPMAASLADVLEIFRLAKEAKVPCFSSSSLRFNPDTQAIRNGKYGEIRRATAWGPYSTEPHHPDLFWYGIHGVETLYTIMGTGCQTVIRVAPEKVVGQWANGREGTYESSKTHGGKAAYGADVEGSKGKGGYTGYGGYRPMLVEIVKFFQTGKPPVAAEETIELFAFMEAADESKRQGGKPVTIESVMAKARVQAAK